MSPPRYSLIEVLNEFRAHGVEPTFASYTDPNQRLAFLCSCTEHRPGETTFRAVHHQGIIPKCPICKLLARQDRMRANRRVQVRPAPPKAAPGPDKRQAIVERYRRIFAEHGVTPLADYIDGKTTIPFQCRGTECNGGLGAIIPAALRRGQVPRCYSCQEANRARGEDHPRWDPDRPPEEREGDRSKAWEAAVLEAHDDTCVITGRIGRAPHHIYGHAGFPELRLLLQNGVCLTRRLHDEFTARHPDGQNTYADFVAFFEEKTGRRCDIPDPMLIPASERIFID